MPSLLAWNRTPASAVCLAALLAVAVWAGEARAGCGDHVVILKRGGPSAEPVQPSSPPPCSGPHCSLKRESPAPLPPTPVSTTVLPLDAVLPADPPDDPARGEWLWIDHFPPPAGHPADIFHPPR
jgi:hypothetical protein